MLVASQFLPIGIWLERGIRWIGHLGTLGVLIFIALYIALSTAGVPIIPLNIAAGVLLGPWLGFSAGLVAASASAMLCFVLARTWLAAWVERMLARHPRFAAMLAAIEHGGWQMVLLIRVMPLVPVVLKNYGFGLTHLRPRNYVLPMVVSLIPNVLIYTYLGSIGYLTLSGNSEKLGGWKIVLYVTVGVAAAACAVGILLLARREMRRQMNASHPAPPTALQQPRESR